MLCLFCFKQIWHPFLWCSKSLKLQLEMNLGLKKISCSCGVSNRLTLLTIYLASLVPFTPVFTVLLFLLPHQTFGGQMRFGHFVPLPSAFAVLFLLPPSTKAVLISFIFLESFFLQAADSNSQCKGNGI